MQFWALLGFLLLIVQVMVEDSMAERILITSMGFSHIYGLAAIGRELEKKGHEVRFLAPQHAEESTLRAVGQENKFKIIFHGQRSQGDGLAGSLVNLTQWSYAMQEMKVVYVQISDDYCNLLKDVKVMSLLKQYSPDFCLIDYFNLNPGSLMVPYALGARYGTRIQALSKLDVASILPSWYPHGFVNYDNNMHFLQRLHSTLSYILFMGYFGPLSYWQWTACCNTTYPGHTQFRANADIVLLDSDVTLEYAIPLPPKVVFIGGAQIKSPKPLSQDLTHYFQQSEKVIFLAIGSQYKNYPSNVISAVLFLMDQLDDYSLLMVLDGGNVSHPRIKTVLHAPQIDILGHSKVQLFISHCGAGSQIEAVYNAKPILCLPIGRDQRRNGGRIRQRGMGLTLPSFWEVTGHELLEAATEILNQPSYLKTAQKLSAIFHEQPLKPAERGAHWVDHVVRHGSYHLQFAGDDLWWWQYYLNDVWFIMVIGVVVWLSFLYYGCRCFCFTCRKKIRKEKQH